MIHSIILTAAAFAAGVWVEAKAAGAGIVEVVQAVL